MMLICNTDSHLKLFMIAILQFIESTAITTPVVDWNIKMLKVVVGNFFLFANNDIFLNLMISA